MTFAMFRSIIRPPRGLEVRRLIGGVTAGVAVAQWVLSSNQDAHMVDGTIMAAQVALDRYGISAISFFLLAISLLASSKCRCSPIGRIIAGIAGVIYLLFASTFWPYAPSGVTTYGVIAVALLVECINPWDG